MVVGLVEENDLIPVSSPPEGKGDRKAVVGLKQTSKLDPCTARVKLAPHTY
jgi:hypothetical protein